MAPTNSSEASPPWRRASRARWCSTGRCSAKPGDAMDDAFRHHAERELQAAASAGMARRERLLAGPQGGHVTVGSRSLLNLCANDYLGLAAHPEVIAAARRGLERWGFGL